MYILKRLWMLWTYGDPVSPSTAEPGGRWGWGVGWGGVMSVGWWWVNLGIMRADVATDELSGDTTRADATGGKVGFELAT